MPDVWRAWLSAAIILLAAAVAGWALHWLLHRIVGTVTRRTQSVVDESLVGHVRRPVRIAFMLLAMLFALPLLNVAPSLLRLARHAISLVLIAVLAWALVASTRVLDDLLATQFDLTARDNLAARQAQTQVVVLRRIFVVAVAIVAVAVMLMTFPAVRNLGASLLASAGLAGLALGMAARPALSNLIAGVQIALTQPIRLDDVVVVDGESGRIEDITTSYVVVRLWDLRRLIVPLSRFIEQSFENWTHTRANILGAVYLYTDYTVPVDEVREEFLRILEASDLWDGEQAKLEVVDATERAVKLRGLMSAPDSGTAWTLRCTVREKLIDFLQRRYPGSLPRTRAVVEDREIAPRRVTTGGG
jgi:small-conductance mechanosensitive channel